MATEKRLIDANNLEAQFRKTKIIEVFPYWHKLDFATKCELVNYGTKCKEIIMGAPTVDAVEVVRCKDCRWRKQGALCYMISGCGVPVGTDNDFFCSYGERRTDGR